MTVESILIPSWESLPRYSGVWGWVMKRKKLKGVERVEEENGSELIKNLFIRCGEAGVCRFSIRLVYITSSLIKKFVRS
jgi:hypothetical protein